jgi:hypothetical protein
LSEERKTYRKKYYEEHKSEEQQKMNEWQKSHKSNKRNSNLLSRYGINCEEYEKMFTEQSGCCAICGRHQSVLTTTLAVDHYHIRNFKKFPPEEKKKYIRGLLCFRCNRGIFAENPDLLLSASVYFRRHEHMKIPFSAVKN